MLKAWQILENLYGDKDLIASKLKGQLKAIRGKGKTDYDLVIDLVTDVNNIILHLKAIDKEEALHVDSEFLAAVYRALPSHNQTKWLEFDKSPYRSKWAGFVKFLEVARNQAVQNKVLLSEYNQSGSGCSQRSGHVGAVTSSSPVDNPNSKQDREKFDRASCGTCPLCHERHTFYNVKEKEMWPSDRLFRCESFKNLGLKDRADTLERFNCCSRCTSWNHQKEDCKVTTKCRNIVDNKVCGGLHFSFACCSGSAYCGAVVCLTMFPVTIANLDSETMPLDDYSLSSEFPDLNAE